MPPVHTDKIRVYPSRALSHAPASFDTQMKEFQKTLPGEHPDCQFLDFFGLGPATAGQIVMHDVACVCVAQLILALAEIPSYGQGDETGLGLGIGTPVLYVVPKSWSYRTRMVTGKPEVWPSHFLYREYNEVDEVHGFIREAIGHFGLRPGPLPKQLEIAPHVQSFYRTHVLGAQPVSNWKS